MGAGLVLGVGNDPDVRLPAFDGRAERQGQAAEGRFGPSPRTEHVELGSPAELGGVELFGQPAVQVRRGPAEVIGQVLLPPGDEIEPLVAAAGQAAGLAVSLHQLVAEIRIAQPSSSGASGSKASGVLGRFMAVLAGRFAGRRGVGLFGDVGSGQLSLLFFDGLPETAGE